MSEIKLVKSTFYKEEETKSKLVDFILQARILSMGEQCKKFEEEFAKKQERKFAVFVNSGSSANLLVLQALINLGSLKKGDKVGFSSLTWSTNVMPIIQLGLTPVAIDVEVETLNVSPRTLRQKIDDIDALFLTNVLGFADDIQEIKSLCNKENIILLEDNCESLGSKADGELLGNFGLSSTFSFFVGHHISTIEGGMVVTDDKELYQMLCISRAHGWDRNINEQEGKELRKKYNIGDFFSGYTFYDLAYNLRPTEIQGFLGCHQVVYWDEIVKKREENFKRFSSLINNNEDFISLDLNHMEIISNFAVPVICKDKEIFNRYKNKFEESKVEIRPIIAGDITRQPFYKKYVYDVQRCENADFIHQHAFYFGNNPELVEKEFEIISELLV